MSKIKERLEELTSEILLKYDMYKIPANILKIAEYNEIDVFKTDLGKDISGAIKYNSTDNKFAILLNAKESEERQRFTLAHELGHYFLHQNKLKDDEIHVDAILYRNTINKEEEREVDYFAGALLMNRTLLEKIYEKTTSINELAAIFEVSTSAMTVRLDILGLL